jgi:uncharacterized small protein (DUF1192 family)
MNEETIVEEIAPEEIENEPQENIEPEQEPEKKEETEQEKYGKRVQKRIDKLKWEKNEEQRRVYALQQELEQLRAQPQQKQQKEGAPNPDDFAAGRYDPDYIEALTEYKAKVALDKYQQSVKMREREANVATLQQTAKEQYADYDDATEEFLAHPLASVKEFNDLLMDTDNPVELAYYLGKNPDQLDKISDMTPAQANRYLGRLEAQIEKKPPSLEPAPKPVSNAPKPVAPVGSANPKIAVKDPSEMSMDEYIAYRKTN